jgi:hypothetical protein
MKTDPRLALSVLMLAMNGCAVGMAHVTAPERLPPKDLPPLTHPVDFDVCISRDISPPSAFESQRAAHGEEIRKVLARAGVPAELTPVAGSSVSFTLKSGTTYEWEWSLFLSFLTFSLVPGYGVQLTTVDVNLSWLAADQVEKIEHLQYRSRMHVFWWLPLVVYPDFFFGISGGWESSKVTNAGYEQILERLGDDMRTRLGRESAGAGADENPKVGVACR